MTPNNRGGGELEGEGAVIRGFIAFVSIAVILGIVFSRGCVRDQPNANWNKPPDGWGRAPWEEDPKVRAERERREAEERRKFAEESTKFYQRMDEREKQVRALTTEDKYRDAVTLANTLGREHSADARRFGLDVRLQSIQQEAVRAACNIAKAKSVRLIGQDQYPAAAEVIEELFRDVGPYANECGLGKELEDIYQASLFVKDLAKAAEKAGTK